MSLFSRFLASIRCSLAQRAQLSENIFSNPRVDVFENRAPLPRTVCDELRCDNIKTRQTFRKSCSCCCFRKQLNVVRPPTRPSLSAAQSTARSDLHAAEAVLNSTQDTHESRQPVSRLLFSSLRAVVSRPEYSARIETATIRAREQLLLSFASVRYSLITEKQGIPGAFGSVLFTRRTLISRYCFDTTGALSDFYWSPVPSS